MARVLVVGATGYLGSHMVAELKSAGHWVRALSRRRDAFDGCDRQPDEVFVGQATQPKTLIGLCDKIDYVFSALGLTRQKGPVSFWDVDYNANKTVLNLAIAAGVKQFLFVSVIRPELSADLDIVAAREALVRDMAMSPIACTVVRATGFFSDMYEFIDMAKSGRIWLIGQGAARINPVHGSDVARAAIEAFDSGKIEIEVGGPEIFTYARIADLSFAVLGKPPRVSRVPVWLVEGLLAALRPINRRQYTTFAFLVRMMRNDMIAPPVGTLKLRAALQARAIHRASC